MTIKIASEIEDYLCVVGNIKGHCYTRKESQAFVSSLFAFMIEKQYSVVRNEEAQQVIQPENDQLKCTDKRCHSYDEGFCAMPDGCGRRVVSG